MPTAAKEILFVAPDINRLAAGGAGLSSLDTLVALAASGHNLTVLSRGRCRIPDELRRGMRCRPTWRVTGRDSAVGGRFGAWVRHGSDLLAPRRIKALRPDVTVVEGIQGHRMMERLREWPRRNRVIIVRGTPDQFSARYRPTPENLDRVIEEIRTYDGFVSVSRKVAEKWRPLFAENGPEFHVIHNCCREDRVRELLREDRRSVQRRLGLNPERLNLVCVASIQPRKGQDFLLDQVPAMLAVVPDLELHLVGRVVDEWGGGEIARRAESKELRGRVRLWGERPDGMDFIRAADVMVLPSREEALPRVVLEAMALKTPVLASDVDGIPEMIAHGKSGTLFDPGAPASFLAGFAEVAGDRLRRESLAEAASNDYWGVFSRALQCERWNAFLDGLLK